jgi:hypothetical protein
VGGLLRPTRPDLGVPTRRSFARGGLELHLAVGMVGSSRAFRLIFSVARRCSFTRIAFAEGIVTKTAPAPLFRFAHQSPLRWIAMQVAWLLDAVAVGPKIKVVEPALADAIHPRVYEIDSDFPTSQTARDMGTLEAPQGLKPTFFGPSAARLKSCPPGPIGLSIFSRGHEGDQEALF